MLIFDQLNKADRTLRVLAWVIAAGLLTLTAGLWWVQIVRSRHYAEDQRNQSYRTVRIPAPRGKIMDRNGVVLAENRPSYNVSLYLEDRRLREAIQGEYKRRRGAAMKAAAAAKRKITKPELEQITESSRYAVVSNIVAQIGEHLGEPLMVVEKNFHRHYQQKLALPLQIKTSLDSTQVARLQERSLSLPGVEMETQPNRVYPSGAFAAHVLGYLTRSEDSAEDELSFYNYRLPDYRGLFGIEASFDDDLRGRAGAKSVLVNNLGYRQTETILSPVEPGRNVILTIDSDIQRVAEHALATAPGGGSIVRGAAVVLDVRNGEVVAMASTPAFNPNDWIPFLPHATWDTYTNEDFAPLQNRALYGNFMPGSTFKIMVALAGLEAGTLHPEEILTVEPNPVDSAHGYYKVGNHVFKDTAPPGEYNFKRAFVKSSNSYFIEQGLRVGPERIVAMAQRFHFGERSGIPLQDGRGLLPTSDWVRQNRGAWSRVATGNLSIGQGDLDITPLQLCVTVAAVANGGKVLTPQLVLAVRAMDDLRPATDHVPLRPVVREDAHVSPASLRIVQEAMFADVHDPDGTGKGALIEGYPVCAKTGTAQVFKGAKYDHHTVWFASYAPFENPRYAIVVMVDHGASGGGTCAPVAKKIYQALQYRDQRSGSPQREIIARN